MKKLIVSTVTVLSLMFTPPPARADMFGGDVAVLVQILYQAIQQLIQLRAILNTGNDTLGLLQDINRGINDSLGLLRTAGINIDPGIYGDLVKVQDALSKVQSVYGIVVPSQDAGVQRDTDQNVSEAITFNNSLYQYSKDIDVIGEQVKQYSHSVSPGGAQKLTAQTLGVMLHVMNQQLRAQATGLKLQAQNLALENKKEKDSTKHLMEVSGTLKTAMKNENPSFSIPRF